MSEENSRALSLDDLFGQAQSMVVLHEGVRYELPKLKTLSPKKLQRFQELGKEAFKLQKFGKDDFTKEQATEVEDLLDEILTMLCKELPLKPVSKWQRLLAHLRKKKLPTPLTFEKKMAVVMYYGEETQGKKAVWPTAQKKTTGPRRSAA